MSIKKRDQKPPRFEILAKNIPERLRSQKRWLMWSWKRGTSKWDKPPLAVDGGSGSSTDPSTWVTFEEALAASPKFDGIGFAMGKTGCGVVGVDLDNCRDPETGELTEDAKGMIAELDTYTEVSPSGEGVKMWLEGSIENAKTYSRKNNDLGIEVYENGRYFTVTGHSVGPAKPMAKAGAQLKRFLTDYMHKSDAFKERPEDPSHTIEIAREAIFYLDANDYEMWIRCGMALKWLDESLLPLWFEWSQTAERDQQSSEDECRAKWASFPGAKGRLTIGSLFRYAQEAGYIIPPTRYENTDYGVARRVRDYLAGKAKYIPEWKKWYVWNGKAFVEDKTNVLVEAIIATSKQMLLEVPKSAEVDTGDEKADKKTNEENAKKDKAWQSFCMRYQSCRGIFDVEKLCRGLMAFDYQEFDQNLQIIHCDNYALHLQTNGTHCVLAHGMENLNTVTSPVIYDADAKCPRWEQFIQEVTGGDKALAEYLQRIAGYCLTGMCDEQVLFVLHGDGQNGKGVFTRTLLQLLGKSYAGPVSQELLMASPNQHPTIFADLYGKRVVVAQETDQDCRLNENQVKMLTGGDPIQCRRMHENFWSFEPTHKIFLATNHIPQIRGTDNGIWRRIKLIPFKVIFTEEQKDAQLSNKLQSELSGILNWALEGWGAYCWDKLAEPEAVTNARADYREEMSTVQQFVEDRCVAAPGASAKICDLYQNFKLYCELHGHYVCSSRKFGLDLTQLGFPASRTNRDRIRRGIKIIDDELKNTSENIFAEA